MATSVRVIPSYRHFTTWPALVISTLGTGYEEDLIAPVFRSQAADVSARFVAKDMYSEARRSIEKEIADSMRTLLEPRGFVIESVLMKSIELPGGLAAAIERKLQAEQRAEEMRFVIDREKLVAKRKRIQAEGDRDAQKLLAESLTEPVLRWLAIQAFDRLSSSSNAKVVITDGSTPLNIVPPEPGPYD